MPLSYLKSAPLNLLYCKFWFKIKYPQIWDEKCLIWVFLGFNLKVILSYLNQHLRIFLISNFGEKTKFIWDFLGQNFKKLLSYLKLAPSILPTCKISRKKRKCLNLGPKMNQLGVFGTEFKNNSPYLKSAPSNLSYCKISQKNENAYIWDKKCLIWVFLRWTL